MTIYTALMVEEPIRNSVSWTVIGSFKERRDAIAAAVKRISLLILLDEFFARTMKYDENHPEAEEMFYQNEDGEISLEDSDRFLSMVRDEIGGGGFSAYYQDEGSIYISIEETEVL